MPALPYWLFPGDDRPTDQIDDEIAEELQLHLDLLAEDQERRGHSPEEAKQKAAERFGDFNQLLRRCRREKQGDVPMLKRVQAMLIGLLLLGVVAIGWNQIAMTASVTANQKDIADALASVQRQLEQIVPRAANAGRWVDDSNSVYVAGQDGKPLLAEKSFGLQLAKTSDGLHRQLVAIDPDNPNAAVVVWTPPENPDPQKIKSEARADAKAKRYDIALAKHVWYHENVESIQPSQSAVRLSFALSEWYDLGLEYPPALEVLRSIRDNLEKQVLRGEDIGRRFHDFAAINRVLDESSKTTKAFAALDSQSPKAAKSAFHFAKRDLLANEAYALYAKHVDNMRGYELISQTVDAIQHRSNESPQEGEDPISQDLLEHFHSEAANIVAVLTMTDRKEEAAKVAELFKLKLDDEQFHKEIDAALEGTLPAQ